MIQQIVPIFQHMHWIIKSHINMFLADWKYISWKHYYPWDSSIYITYLSYFSNLLISNSSLLSVSRQVYTAILNYWQITKVSAFLATDIICKWSLSSEIGVCNFHYNFKFVMISYLNFYVKLFYFDTKWSTIHKFYKHH